MKYRKKTIQELNHLLATHQVTSEELALDFIQEAKKDAAANFLTTLPENEIIAQAKAIDAHPNFQSLLTGVPYLAKDNFATKGIRTTGGSKILENFIPPYNATIIDILNGHQALMAGKASLDELGMGGTGLLSAFGEIYNPYDKKRLIGGSSSGSVYAVSKGYVPFALGTDTGDSIRKPASYTGIVGFKPTYGALSRYGVLPYSPSLDHPGFFTRNVADMAIVADATFQHDAKDFTSQEIPHKDFLKHLGKLPKSTKFGYLKVVQENLDPKLKKAYFDFYQKLSEAGFEVKALDFPKELLDALPSIYMMISFTEAVSTHSNLTGVHFGERVENADYETLMRETRSKCFGPVVKRRFLIGSLNLKKDNQELFMNKAKKVRRLIVEELNKLYNKVNILILPAAPGVAPLIDEAVEYETDHDDSKAFINDVLVLGNLSGMPSITLPFVFENGLPIGINLNAAPKKDRLVLQAAKKVETLLGYENHDYLDKKLQADKTLEVGECGVK
ncbi:aspartyl/glutamyl-tRNA(Asn/Gln) amidotransferase subunit A [Entomoplasma freundtii]|uniref:Aspartyl/glutamyl-tRNA amidotransferase subunit A n=1 Tax=Entomoplasma freundtii TaxID=74700 RepID=A0A2K8NS93_9MOLU|nr:amidase family protein [Entomoplasma freundtii]ATZ16624.1 aspartyl/glutamyl-tRNA amidotransferase subunit A [Entomoplasma freundtii]TDY58209.1 aspartyl/glutamyl-tRNA(Asn/Gln) amidotransferase subunit A [Entomoplasma freundtii]